jgi:hypothetical protein
MIDSEDTRSTQTDATNPSLVPIPSTIKCLAPKPVPARIFSFLPKRRARFPRDIRSLGAHWSRRLSTRRCARWSSFHRRSSRRHG